MKLFEALLLSNSGSNQYKEVMCTIKQAVSCPAGDRARADVLFSPQVPELKDIKYSNIIAISCDSTEIWNHWTGAYIDISWYESSFRDEDFEIDVYVRNQGGVTIGIPANTIKIKVLYMEA